MDLFPRLDPEAFDALILCERRPVVVAYVRFDASLAPVIEALWHLRLTFGDSVAPRLLDAETDRRLGARLGLSEPPPYVVYRQGRELARLPGSTDGPGLEAILLHRGFVETS
jgi:hypothetical protein